MENISSACLMIYDELKDDPESVDIITLIDEAEGDSDIIKGVQQAVERLKAIGKPNIADAVKEKTTGFAF